MNLVNDIIVDIFKSTIKDRDSRFQVLELLFAAHVQEFQGDNGPTHRITFMEDCLSSMEFLYKTNYSNLDKSHQRGDC